MVDLALETFKYIQIPALIICLLVMMGMFYLMIQKDKAMEKMREDSNNNIKEGFATLAQIVTLLDFLVNGRIKV